MTDWEPATEAEAALRDALRSNDQQLYFRILSSIELLLPISAPTVPGSAPAGWGTWTTGGRTHVLAFTSVEAMRACLGEYGASARRTGYAELATGWPNHEWWLAVNPGLPIEGYLPAWYVAQLSRGDVRLPGRTVGARARLERVEAMSRLRESGPAANPPAQLRPSRPEMPPPVIPAAFQLSDVAVTAPGAGTRVPGQPPAGQPTGYPGAGHLRPSAPEPRPGLSGQRPDLAGGARPETADGLWGDRQGHLPPRQPMPPPGETLGRPVTAEQDGAPANGQAADHPPRRSFFEPASGRTASRSERATAPSRFSRSGQPFPRRGQAPESTADGTTRAFDFSQDAQTGGLTRPDANGEATQPLRPPADPSPEPTQRLWSTAPTDLTGSVPGDPTAETQALPRRQSTEGGEQTLPSAAEPVSAPPEPRRGFTPIVIEGTIIEARDLTSGPPAQQHPEPGTTQRQAPEAGPTLPPTSEAPQTWPTEAEPTAPITPRQAEPTTTFFPSQAERTVSLSPSQGEPEQADPTTTLFPAQAEQTVAMSPSQADPTTLFPSQAEQTVSLSPSQAEPVEADPTTTFFPSQAESTVSLSPSQAEPVEADPTTTLFPAQAESTVSMSTSQVDPTTTLFPAQAEQTVAMSPAQAEPTQVDPTMLIPAQAESTVAMSSSAAEPTVVVPAVADEVTAPVPATEPSLFDPSPSHKAAAGPEPEDTVATPTLPLATPEPATASPPEEPAPASGVSPAGFEPANEVEEDLLAAAGAAKTDTFLSTLLLARVLLPIAPDSAPGSRPGDPGYVWPTVELDDQTFVVAYTSPQRLADHGDQAAETMTVRFVQLIRSWPQLSWSFAVNPGTPVGAKLPGEQIVGLANWAAELGLGDDNEPEPGVDKTAATSSPPKVATAADPTRPIVMQKAIAPSQLGFYLERGYDRVSGFVHRATELAHLTTPDQLYRALGLQHPESPFAADAEEIYVLRWPAYRPSLYRIPYGGQNEAAMRAMEGWVIERPPFRGNGFAPGESSEVLAEFKVDSVRLPHGAQLLRLGADGTERLIAVFDADTVTWCEAGAQ
ncbi:SseB family protein [Micromonospora sp. DT229]|uniref:SseB family protein n=1 Tax=Micromonospora sp. DT229 TaxID=3393430 RepID=UPI003CED6B1C